MSTLYPSSMNTITPSQKVLSVIESLGKGSIGFLCGVVHANFAVVQAGVYSRLHIVIIPSKPWTVLIESQQEGYYGNQSPSSSFYGGNGSLGAPTSSVQKQSRMFCSFEKGKQV